MQGMEENAPYAKSADAASAFAGSQSSNVPRTMTEKMSQFGEQDAMGKSDKPALSESNKRKPRAQWKIKTEKLLENYYWVGMMSIVTFYALFADDLRVLLLPKSADTPMDVLTLLAMTLYLIELILGFLAVEGYLCSFYFWVDLISLLSMVPDITFVMEAT